MGYYLALKKDGAINLHNMNETKRKNPFLKGYILYDLYDSLKMTKI